MARAWRASIGLWGSWRDKGRMARRVSTMSILTGCEMDEGGGSVVDLELGMERELFKGKNNLEKKNRTMSKGLGRTWADADYTMWVDADYTEKKI